MPNASQHNLSAIHRMETFDSESGDLNVIVETPKGSRNKFTFDENHGLFKLSGVLPEGAAFPFEFGFLPSTLGEDGDPLDIVVMLDTPTSVGCLITVRPIGVIEAEQTEKGKTERNDRLIAVATHAHVHSEVKSLKDLNAKLVDEMEHFFISYNQIRGKVFKPLGRFGPKRSLELIQKGRDAFAKANKAK
ncbi:MAG: inorganic diphosphatase [Acidobacteriota bacterium]|nr:inorganic diphosphatase [Acidobacteriota bacterium]